jgi:hypothetical protein
MGLVIMGQINTEQAVEIIEAVGNAIPESTPMQAEPNMNFWPLLAIAVVPVVLAPFVAMWVKRKFKK